MQVTKVPSDINVHKTSICGRRLANEDEELVISCGENKKIKIRLKADQPLNIKPNTLKHFDMITSKNTLEYSFNVDIHLGKFHFLYSFNFRNHSFYRLSFHSIKK